MSNVNLDNILYYNDVAEGIDAVAPEIIESGETRYLYMQYKCAKKVLESRIKGLIEEQGGEYYE